MREHEKLGQKKSMDHTRERLVLPEGKTGSDLFVEEDWKDLGRVLFPSLNGQGDIPQLVYSDTAGILAQAAVFMGDGKREEDFSNLVTTHKATDRPLSHKRAFAVAKVKSAMILMDSLRRNEGQISLIDYATAKTYHLIEELKLTGEIPPWEKDRDQRIFLPFAGLAIPEMNALTTSVNITNPGTALNRLRQDRESFISFGSYNRNRQKGFSIWHSHVEICALDNSKDSVNVYKKHSKQLIPTINHRYIVGDIQHFSLGKGEKPFDLCAMLKVDPAFFPDPEQNIIYKSGDDISDELVITGRPTVMRVKELFRGLKKALKPGAPVLVTFGRTSDLKESRHIQHAVMNFFVKGRKWNIHELTQITDEMEQRGLQPHDNERVLVGRAPKN